MGEAVQNPSPRSQPGRGGPVILLVQEETRLLSGKIIHIVGDPVLADQHVPVGFPGQALPMEKPHEGLHPLFPAQGGIAALIDRADLLPLVAQQSHQMGQEHIPAHRHAQAVDLHGQHILKPVHRDAGKAVRLPEQEPAAGEILPHDRTPVIQRIPEAAGPEGLVQLIVGVSGDDAHEDLAAAVIKAGSQVLPFSGIDVRGLPVRTPLPGNSFFGIHPGVSSSQALFRLGRDGDRRIRTHGSLLLSAHIRYHTMRRKICPKKRALRIRKPSLPRTMDFVYVIMVKRRRA